ncbi:acetyltransferase [Alkalihalophilus pseudofirmus OF4]|jgi:ribosomal protein S18 acetylase RimI-like enzyme|uniref:Acetyltransferase n=1 Tax=Alkalihalophilus pseudofirmus (strain ATCC BAA-2126 / JCM 17055 / OF4) TaxID=398511 RepID=D3FS81_ALKPO|nr:MULTISPECIES: GNAT family N-acetyltransferase [Alkalihalophilus]ADC51716.1 acetyltransferase [Alkalihalophilus pseudofirmus OF4]MED1600372.1 GNAT family N-acetyltransferase [Alkalihalophilus marmarensis]
MDIRLLDAANAYDYKCLRLRALKHHPEAFSSSYEEEKKWSLKKTEKRLTLDHFITFGAYVDEQLVGMVTLLKEEKQKIMHRGTIVAMYVAPEQRKSGIGKALVKQAILTAKNECEMERIYLTVTSTNLPAKRLYESLGFTPYGVDQHALKIDDCYYDEDLMVLAL